ncbi:unnamed protein product [Durusdinium trenchii]|uniref:Uncharacterized protein n=1 Tax=Durusdinium trenchii TaxID=1381693 RepID=A0ABP0RPN7_9DINO
MTNNAITEGSCVYYILKVLYYLFVAFLELVGLSVDEETRNTIKNHVKLIIDKIGEEDLNSLEQSLAAVPTSSATDCLFAVWRLCSEFAGAFVWPVLNIVIHEFWHKLPWWQWVETAVVAIAQMLLWFAGPTGVFAMSLAAARDVTSLVEAIEGLQACRPTVHSMSNWMAQLAQRFLPR